MSNSIQKTLELAISAHNQGQYTSCEDICLAALERTPDNPDINHILGLANYSMGRLQPAIERIEHALGSSPNNPLFHANLATVFNDAENLEQAQQHYLHAVRLDPENAASLNGLGIIARKRLNYNLAIDYYRRALKIDGDFAVAHNNLSNVLTLIGQLRPALKHAETALSINPESAEAWNNLGFAHTMLGEFERANQAIEKALELDPNLAVANFNMAANLLRRGDYSRGWDMYEWRLRLNGQNPHLDPTNLTLPNLRELENATILLIAEQGMGDFIQFVRFAEKLSRIAAEITVSCDKRLIPLIQHLPWWDEIIPRGNTLPAKDHVIPMMSLARVFETRLETIPSNSPYISVPIEKTLSWREKLSVTAQLVVGLTWFGNPDNPVNVHRSPPLAQLEILAKVQNIRFVSLQTGNAVEDLLTKKHIFDPIDLGIFTEQKELRFCFTDTAAILLNLDLFITSCTVTAHLAGALGVPTFLVLSYVADWRWGMNETTSSWYPSIRIFRQHAAGDWEGVFKDVKAALQHKAANRPS